MPRYKVKDLKEIIDPKARYLFLDDQGMTEAFLITSVEKQSIIVSYEGLPKPEQRRAGYFVAPSGQGIVRFTGTLACLQQTSSPLPLPLYRLTPDLAHLKLIDRREFIRKVLPHPVMILFNFESQYIQTKLINLSEGGLRLSANRPLPMNIISQFELKLPQPRKSPFEFKTDGLVVYSEPEEDPAFFMIGVSFIAPKFLNEEEKKSYQEQRKQLSHYLTTINQ